MRAFVRLMFPFVIACGAPPAEPRHETPPATTPVAPPTTATPPPPPTPPPVDEARRCSDASDCVYVAGRCGMLDATNREHVPAPEPTTGNPVDGCPQWLPDYDPTRGPFRLECRSQACTVVVDGDGLTECTDDGDCVAVDQGCSWRVESTTAPNHHAREPGPTPPCILPAPPQVTCFRGFCIDVRSLSAPPAPAAARGRAPRAP